MSKAQGALRQIWMVSREYGSLAGAGGVKDVALQLAQTLARWNGRSVHVVLPRYGFVEPEKHGFQLLSDPLNEKKVLSFDVDLNYSSQERREQVQVWKAVNNRVNLYLIEAQRFSEKQSVYTYTEAEEKKESWQKAGEGHYDYFAMNILLQKASLDLMMILRVRPDVIHCHDGHTAVLPALIAEHPGLRHCFRETGTVVTIHNAGKGYHQEVADLEFARECTGLPMRVVVGSRLGLSFDPFLAAASSAVMNTVSENYARELQETTDDELTGWLGQTLLKRGVLLEGVTNGIDPEECSPKDHLKSGVAASYDPLDASTLSGKQLCKQDMLDLTARGRLLPGVERSGYLDPDPSVPLLTFIGRLSEQKGVDVLIGALTKMLAVDNDFHFLLLGSGNHADEIALANLAEKRENRGRVCILRGFSPALANKIYAAGDFFLIPSQYEPCGLTDFMAQLFGNLPVVHRVGGLVKVIHGRTGFSYREQTVAALCSVIRQALSVYRTDKKSLHRMQAQAVQTILDRHTWDTVSKKYLKLYKKARTVRILQV